MAQPANKRINLSRPTASVVTWNRRPRVPGVPAPDGDELDAYVLGIAEARERFTGRCIAVVHRLDDDDDKLVVVPDGVQLSDAEVTRLTKFQERYFTSTILRS